MSLIPEFSLQSVIVRGLRTLKTNSKLVDQLFRNLDQAGLKAIRDFLRTNAIDICMNYPREDLKLPSIVILLKSDSESQGYLGDSMSMEVPEEFSFDSDSPMGVGNFGSLSQTNIIEFGPYTASGGSINSLIIDEYLWAVDQYAFKNYKLVITEGTGYGQSRVIVSNRGNSLTVSQPWATIPDSTSVFTIRRSGDEIMGEPTPLYDKQSNPIVERRGYMNNASYQLQVIGANPDQAIFLSSILKSILLISRVTLEQQGILNLKVSSTDFAPKNEGSPNFVYTRAINLEFNYSFDIFEEFVTVDKLNVVLEGTTLEAVVTISNTETEPALSDELPVGL